MENNTFNSWILTQLEQDEKIEHLRDILSQRLVAIAAANDMALEIVVPVEIEAETREALATIYIPENAPLAEGVDRASAELQFREMHKDLRVSSRPLEHFMIEDANIQVPPEHQFIVVITRNLQTSQVIANWDQQIGLSASLMEMGLQPSAQEVRLCLIFMKTLELIGKQQTKLEAARGKLVK